MHHFPDVLKSCRFEDNENELIDIIEAISKIGFWFKFAAGPRFKPEEYFRISRI